MLLAPFDSYWSRQYSWEKVSTKNGLSSPHKSLNCHAHDFDHASRTRLSVEGDVAVSVSLLSIFTTHRNLAHFSSSQSSAYTPDTLSDAYHTREVYIVVRGIYLFQGLWLSEQIVYGA